MIGQLSTAISPVVGSISSVIVPSSLLSGNVGARRGEGNGDGVRIGSGFNCSIGGDGDGNSTGVASSIGTSAA